MNRAPACSTCLAWDETADEPGRGTCRRHAPKAEVVVVTADDGREGLQVFSCWPNTGAAEGCLDHLPLTPPPGDAR